MRRSSPTRGRPAICPCQTSRIEVFHPDQSAAQRADLLGLALDLGLVATGGSDDHGGLTGHRIGCETTAADAYEALLAQATGAEPIRHG